jgi:hypothetical protein
MSLGAYSYGVVAEFHCASPTRAVDYGCELTETNQLKIVVLLRDPPGFQTCFHIATSLVLSRCALAG